MVGGTLTRQIFSFKEGIQIFIWVLMQMGNKTGNLKILSFVPPPQKKKKKKRGGGRGETKYKIRVYLLNQETQILQNAYDLLCFQKYLSCSA